MTPHIPLSQAIAQYLANVKKELAPSTFASRRTRLIALQADLGDLYLDELTPYGINAWLYNSGDPASEQDISAFRQLAKWCNANMGAYLYIPPARKKVLARDYLRLPQGEAVRRWREQAAICASRMHFPHQKAIYLLGYLFGWHLRRIVAATMADIAALPVRSELAEAVEAMALTRPRIGAIFEPWLGRNEKSAQRHWKTWVGKGLPFTLVVNAGNAARMEAGVRPSGGTVRVETLIEALPLVDQDGVRRIEVPRLGRGE